MARTIAHALTIRRWDSVHLVAEDHPAAERVQHQLDDALRAGFDRAIGDALAASFGCNEDLVFVRRLQIDIAVDTAWDRDRLAEAWSRVFARELVQELAAGESDNVVRFPTRARWLASYIVERAAGGGGTWFHRELAGWSALSSSSAIRSVLCDDPAVGRGALRALPSTTRARVAAALTEPDTIAIVQQLAPTREAEIDRVTGLLRKAAMDADVLVQLRVPELSVWFLGASVEPSLEEVVVAVRIFREVVALVAHSSDTRLADLLASLCAEKTMLARCITAAAPARREQLHAALTELIKSSTSTRTVAQIERFTLHGGAFLLLDDLPEHDLITRLLILGRAVGGDDCALFEDDCWRDLCGISPRLRRETVESCAIERAELIEQGARATLERFSARLPGFAGSSASYLRTNFLSAVAALTIEPDRIVVTLSRPPLDLILNISGRSRGERHWPWIDARPFVLFLGS